LSVSEDAIERQTQTIRSTRLHSDATAGLAGVIGSRLAWSQGTYLNLNLNIDIDGSKNFARSRVDLD